MLKDEKLPENEFKRDIQGNCNFPSEGGGEKRGAFEIGREGNEAGTLFTLKQSTKGA